MPVYELSNPKPDNLPINGNLPSEEAPFLDDNLLFHKDALGIPNEGYNLRVKVTEIEDKLVTRIYWEHPVNHSQYELYLVPGSCNVNGQYPLCDELMTPYETVIPVPESGGEVINVAV